MSALCQKRTHAPQQKNSQSLIGAAERARDLAERAHGISNRITASVCLDVGSQDHLGPFLGFIGDEFPERGRCHWHRINTYAGKPRLYEGICRNGVDLLVELLDHLNGRVFRRTDPIPLADRWPYL